MAAKLRPVAIPNSKLFHLDSSSNVNIYILYIYIKLNQVTGEVRYT